MTLPDVDSLTTYGGALQNANPVEDASTDEDAAWRNKYAANVAGMTQTACRAWRSFIGHATTPADPNSNVHGAVWGNQPSVKPTVAKAGTGVYTIAFPPNVVDELGVTHTVNLRRVSWAIEGSTPLLCTATATSPNVVTFRVFDTTGAASDAAGTTFTVFAI